MKAIQITSYDGPRGLTYDTLPEPEPAPEQVALNVEFAGANYVEALFAGGFVPKPLPWVPGIEAAGRIRALGERVEGLAVGDRVAALTINAGGAYGQVAVTHAQLVAPIPAGMDPSLASVVPSNTTTALISLERVAHLRPGEHVLVHAAAGGLGSQFGQIARTLGAGRVVGVVGGEEKKRAALDLGYDEVWLRADLENAEPGQFDVIADPVAGPGSITSLELLRLRGRLLAGAMSAAHPRIVGTYLRRALALVASGEVTVHIAERAPIQDAPRVLTALRDGRTIGKTVFVHERSIGSQP